MSKKKILMILVFLIIIGFAATYMYYMYNKKPIVSTGLDETSKTYEVGKISGRTYSDIVEYTSTSKVTMVVLGRKNCGLCNNFISNLNDLSVKYGFKYLYIDFYNMNVDDYNEIVESNIRIPSKCADTGTEKSLAEGFGTPLTLFFENNEVVDCIRGYKDKDTTLEVLNGNGFLNKKD